jgi:hypothetical protein
MRKERCIPQTVEHIQLNVKKYSEDPLSKCLHFLLHIMEASSHFTLHMYEHKILTQYSYNKNV